LQFLEYASGLSEQLEIFEPDEVIELLAEFNVNEVPLGLLAGRFRVVIWMARVKSRFCTVTNCQSER